MKKELTKLEAFKSMINFLEKHYQFTQSDDIGSLLGGMDLNFQGGKKPFDQALWDDWMDSIEKVLKKESDNK
jgi:hypothetical protein